MAIHQSSPNAKASNAFALLAFAALYSIPSSKLAHSEAKKRSFFAPLVSLRL
jgi:Pyruvate/2-oxoacid:ferredoxin oxidoreductase gamma subunit